MAALIEATTDQVEIVVTATIGCRRPHIVRVAGISVSPIANVVIVALRCAVTVVEVTEPQAVITFVFVNSVNVACPFR